MNTESRMIGEWKVLVPDQTRLDAYVAEDFKRCLVEAVDDGTQHLMIDLTDVQFMDSSGLGATVYCLQRMKENGRIAIAGPQESVSLMLRLTHMDKVFTVVEKPEDILQSAT